MSEETKKNLHEEGEPFFPHHVLQQTMVIFLTLAALVALVIFFPAPMEPPADPFETPEHIKPEWYFLAAYQSLKVAEYTAFLGAWAPKVLGLYEYRFRGKYTERFGTKNLRVLCVTPSASRKHRLIQCTREAIRARRWQSLFCFTTQDEVTVESVLTKPIWQPAGDADHHTTALLGARRATTTQIPGTSNVD